MTTPQPRFSRRFLTTLIIATSLAIALLSRLEEPAPEGQDSNLPAGESVMDQEPTSVLNHAPDS